jgi:hypothetical protein
VEGRAGEVNAGDGRVQEEEIREGRGEIGGTAEGRDGRVEQGVNGGGEAWEIKV